MPDMNTGIGHQAQPEQDEFVGFARATSQAGPNTGIAAVGPGPGPAPGPNTGIAAVGPGPSGGLAAAVRRDPNAALPALSSLDDLLALRS